MQLQPRPKFPYQSRDTGKEFRVRETTILIALAEVCSETTRIQLPIELGIQFCAGAGESKGKRT